MKFIQESRKEVLVGQPFKLGKDTLKKKVRRKKERKKESRKERNIFDAVDVGGKRRPPWEHRRFHTHTHTHTYTPAYTHTPNNESN